MKDEKDQTTPELPGMTAPKRGRPRKPDALTGAERVRLHRIRAKEMEAAGRIAGDESKKDQEMYKEITFTVAGLTDAEAWELAQFLKRAGFSDYRSLAEGDDEARAMQAAGEKVRAGLAAAGYSPR